MPAVRVVVADDHPVFRSGIHDLLDGAEGISVVGEAESGTEALELVEREQPDVLLLDMEMPGLTGPEVAERLQERDSSVRVLALSSYDDQEYVQGLLDSDASGYLTKENAPDLIVEAVRAVADGQVRWFVRPDRYGTQPDPDLTEREREVLRLFARGHSNAEVAEALHIAGSTVRKHATNVYQKLEVDSAREAIAWAWQNGIMSDADRTRTEDH